MLKIIIYNSFTCNIAIQLTVAIVLRTAVAPILGLSGTLAMRDRSKLRHDRVAVEHSILAGVLAYCFSHFHVKVTTSCPSHLTLVCSQPLAPVCSL